jgi:hypothetical protein
MKIKIANKVLQPIWQFKIHPLLLDVQQYTPSIAVKKKKKSTDVKSTNNKIYLVLRA